MATKKQAPATQIQPAKRGRKAGSTVPKDESKAQRFIRLANARVPKTLAAIANVSKLTGNNYEYTQEQAEAITTALATAVLAVKERFAGVKQSAAQFKL